MKKIKTSWLYYFLIDNLRRFFMLLCSVIPLQDKIYVSSYFGGDYGDNAKYILEELRSQGLDYKVVWLLKDSLKNNNILPKDFKAVTYNSLASFYEMATAKVWINNSRFTVAARKRKGQLYIQTWHGGPAMKRIEKDAEAALEKRYVHFAKKDSKMTDCYLSNSKFMTDLYENVFWFDGKVIECGNPRKDIFFGDMQKYADKIKEYYGIDKNKKIAMYGPTFRKDSNLEVYSIDAQRCCKAFSERFGGDWVFLMRLHPNLFDLAENMQTDGDNVINATKYPDIQELLAATDCLITDYSSINIDFLATNRPAFIFATDLAAYTDDRGLYFDFSDTPFPFAEDNDAMVSNILNFDEEKYRKDVTEFNERTGIIDNGTASKTAVELIRKHIEK